MDTGVIGSAGTVRSTTPTTAGGPIRVQTETDGLEPGDSIAVSEVSVTAETVGDGWFEASRSATTAAEETGSASA